MERKNILKWIDIGKDIFYVLVCSRLLSQGYPGSNEIVR